MTLKKHLTTFVAMALATGTLSMVGLAQASAAPVVPVATITQAMKMYSSQLEQIYGRAVSSNARTILKGATLKPIPSSSTMTTDQIKFAETQVGTLRDSFADSGLAIRSAQVISTVLSTNMVGENVIAKVDMTTSVSSVWASDGSSLSSSWSDQHTLTLSPVRSRTGVTYSVISDKYIAPPKNDDETTMTASDLAALPKPQQSSDSLSAASSTSQQESGVASALAQPKINVTKFVNYALKWTAPTNASKMNPAYPSYSNNCTNFGSQVLNNAGFKLIGGNSLQGKNTKVWTYNLAGIAGASWTWNNAIYNNSYVGNYSGAYGWLNNIWNATPGDILYTDWDPNGKADGKIDHMMVVTGRGWVTGTSSPTGKSYYSPLISQKSNNRYNIPLQTSINLAKQSGTTKIVWYGLKHK